MLADTSLWIDHLRHGNARLEALLEQGLMGAGIGWIDAHLLAAAALTRTKLWSLDAKLTRAARRLDLAPRV